MVVAQDERGSDLWLSLFSKAQYVMLFGRGECGLFLL